MTDICDRLEPSFVVDHPMILQEAKDLILRLRAENARVNAWNRQLEIVVRDQAITELGH